MFPNNKTMWKYFLWFLHIRCFWCFSPNNFDSLEGTMPSGEWVEGWFNLSSGSPRSVSGSEKKRWALNIVAILIFYAIVLINPTFFFLFCSFKPFIGDHYTTYRKKNGDENLLQKTCSIGTGIMAPLNNPYAWGLFLVTIHYPPYYPFKALKECISVICVQSLDFRLQTIIQAWSLLIMDFWQLPWSLLVMKFVCILLVGYEIMHVSCMVG